jgi:protein tyrosine phosphatase (PTP) superfamily phosphohydrolase (DUF442 family)
VTVCAFAVACSTDSAGTASAGTSAGKPQSTEAMVVTTLGLKNLTEPLPGLYCAGQPSESQFDLLAKAGVKRVIQLRPASETGSGWEEARAAAAGLTFVRLPIAGADDLTVAHANRLADELGKPDAGPTLLCCGSSNRVGALLAMKAYHVDRRPAAEALAFGKSAGLASLEPKVAALLKP